MIGVVGWGYTKSDCVATEDVLLVGSILSSISVEIIRVVKVRSGANCTYGIVGQDPGQKQSRLLTVTTVENVKSCAGGWGTDNGIGLL